MFQRHVIVMAQPPGGGSRGALAKVASCDGAPVLVRTLLLVRQRDPGCQITVVSTKAVVDELAAELHTSRGQPSVASSLAALAADDRIGLLDLIPDTGSLRDLRDLVDYMDFRVTAANVMGALGFVPIETAVLFGNVLYSPTAMDELVPPQLEVGAERAVYTFVTANERLIGARWEPSADALMMGWLTRAARRGSGGGPREGWITAAQLHASETKLGDVNLVDVLDYTSPYDDRTDPFYLLQLGERAVADDAQRGLRW